jgi:hypothetical protein
MMLFEAVNVWAMDVRDRSPTRRLQPLCRQPDQGRDRQETREARRRVPGEQRAVERLDTDERRQAVYGELAIEKTDAEHQAAEERPMPRDPEEEDVETRFETPAARVDEDGGDAGGRQDERQRCQRGGRRPQSHLAFEGPEQEEDDRAVHDEQRQFQRGRRHAGDGKERSRQPGLHAEHVALPVEEEREARSSERCFAIRP